MKGWSTRDLRALCPCVRSRVRIVRHEFHKHSGERLQAIETARDLERQKVYVRLGVSQTLDSRHLMANGEIPDRLQDARVLAADLAPRPYIGRPLWNPDGRLWIIYGEIALEEGLLWGRDWDDTPGVAPYDGWDSPHVYLEACQCA